MEKSTARSHKIEGNSIFLACKMVSPHHVNFECCGQASYEIIAIAKQSEDLQNYGHLKAEVDDLDQDAASQQSVVVPFYITELNISSIVL